MSSSLSYVKVFTHSFGCAIPPPVDGVVEAVIVGAVIVSVCVEEFPMLFRVFVQFTLQE